MFKTKKVTPSIKAPAKTSAPKKNVKSASKTSAPKRVGAAPTKSAAPRGKNVKTLIKSASARPAVTKSKKGSPLRKRVSAQVGKVKAPAQRAPAAPANLLDAEDPTMKAAQAAVDKKAFDVLVLEVAEISGLCDRMIICSARSTTHLSAVSDAIEDALRKAGQRLLHADGRRTAEPEWVLLDYGDLMVHVFRQQARSDYQLEEYYSDGKVLAKLAYD